jgi:hypothetical protein
VNNLMDESDGMLVVDIDGTLCDIRTADQSYAEVAPRLDMIERLREYQAKGYRIMLYTARNMKTYRNNVGLAGPMGRALRRNPVRQTVATHQGLLHRRPRDSSR